MSLMYFKCDFFFVIEFAAEDSDGDMTGEQEEDYPENVDNEDSGKKKLFKNPRQLTVIGEVIEIFLSRDQRHICSMK